MTRRRLLHRLVEKALHARSTPAPTWTFVPNLTDRERDVLALVGDGLSNPEIAERLRLGVTTVKTHVANLMAKTGSANRVQLAIHAMRSAHG